MTKYKFSQKTYSIQNQKLVKFKIYVQKFGLQRHPHFGRKRHHLVHFLDEKGHILSTFWTKCHISSTFWTEKDTFRPLKTRPLKENCFQKLDNILFRPERKNIRTFFP